MKRKIVAGALLMLSILAGCGSGENSTVSPTPEPVPPSNPTVSQSQPVTPEQVPPLDPAVSQSQPVTPEPVPEESPVPPELGNAVWSDGTMAEGESVKYYSFDDGSYVEYPSEADFLAVFGLAGVDPFYEYSRIGEVTEQRTRLYYSEELGTGCVVADSIYGGMSHKWGLALDRVEQAREDERWTRWKQDPESIPGLDAVKGEVEDYQEQWEYDEAGRLTVFQADGIFDSPWSYENGRTPVASVSLTYGEDGALQARDVFRNDALFGSSGMTQHNEYDALGRVCYETSYITHGLEEFYYLYPDECPEPAYCLYIDQMGSGVILAKY